MTDEQVGQGSPEPIPRLRRLTRAVAAFFFAPATARPLAALRIGLAVVLLVQAWLLRAEALELLAHDGIVQGELARHLDVPDGPRLGWLVDWLAPHGVSEASIIHGACGAYVTGLALLAIGWRTRLCAATSWLLHWTLMTTGYSTSYGADVYAHVFLFYLVLVPAGCAWSLDVARGRASAEPTEGARFGLRMLQLHLCLSYLASGLEKAAGVQWWNGELLWRALSLPVYRQYDVSWLASSPWLSRVGGWATLAIELGYCVFIWPRRTRRPWIAATVALHLGIAVLLGLGVFGAVMAVLTVTAFGVSPEPRRAPAA